MNTTTVKDSKSIKDFTLWRTAEKRVYGKFKATSDDCATFEACYYWKLKQAKNTSELMQAATEYTVAYACVIGMTPTDPNYDQLRATVEDMLNHRRIVSEWLNRYAFPIGIGVAVSPAFAPVVKEAIANGWRILTARAADVAKLIASVPWPIALGILAGLGIAIVITGTIVGLKMRKARKNSEAALEQMAKTKRPKVGVTRSYPRFAQSLRKRLYTEFGTELSDGSQLRFA